MTFSLDTPAPELLARLQEIFREWGAFDQPLPLIYGGQEYLVSCNDHSFTIYRLNPQGHLPPGRPGWPVCLITAELAVDEAGAPHPEEDACASPLTLQEWLDLIRTTLGK